MLTNMADHGAPDSLAQSKAWPGWAPPAHSTMSAYTTLPACLPACLPAYLAFLNLSSLPPALPPSLPHLSLFLSAGSAILMAGRGTAINTALHCAVFGRGQDSDLNPGPTFVLSNPRGAKCVRV